MKCSTVLDLGCNRGIFSLIAAKVLEAQTLIGVEPLSKYSEIHALLAFENAFAPPRMYWNLVGSVAEERLYSSYVSIDTIARDNNLSVIDFAKIDVEGAEAQICTDLAWLAMTQNIAMELHSEFVDIAPAVQAIAQSGFQVLLTNQFGHPCKLNEAMFLYASRNGSLRPQAV